MKLLARDLAVTDSVLFAGMGSVSRLPILPRRLIPQLARGMAKRLRAGPTAFVTVGSTGLPCEFGCPTGPL